MAQTTTSAPQQQTPMPAVDLRQYVGTLVSAEGVRTSTDLVVAQRAAGANMSVDVAAGSAVIQDDHASGGGFYSYTLAATTNVAVTGSDPTNPRVDRVVVRVRDQALGDAANDATVVVVAGTPTSGATLVNLNGAAAVPGSSLLLANVLVPNASSSVTTANIGNVVAIVKPAGTVADIAYVEVTSNLAVAGTSGSPTSVVSSGTITYDGTPIWIEVSLPGLTKGTTNISASIYDGTTELGLIATTTSTAGGQEYLKRRKLTPSAGSHTYQVKAYVDAGSGFVQAQGGGAGSEFPGYIRITKA